MFAVADLDRHSLGPQNFDSRMSVFFKSPLGGARLFDRLAAKTVKRIDAMTIGTVKWFNTEKGYGFIAPDDGSGDVFVHVTALQDSGLAYLSEGERLSFDIGLNTRTNKNKAINLRPMD